MISHLRRTTPSSRAALVATSAGLIIGLFFASYLRLTHFLPSYEFAFAGLAIAVTFYGFAHCFSRRDDVLFVKYGALVAALIAALVMLAGATSVGLSGVAFTISLGLVMGLISLVVLYNPILRHSIDVGDDVFINLIGFAYGLPALLYTCVGYFGRVIRPKAYTMLSFGFAVILGFLWVNMTIRQIFSPGFLIREPVGQAELYTYSVVWLLIGILMLLSGIRLRAFRLRAASGIVIIAVVLKVFFVDLAGLEGLLRAFSFIGLGAVLIGIGFIPKEFIIDPFDGAKFVSSTRRAVQVDVEHQSNSATPLEGRI